VRSATIPAIPAAASARSALPIPRPPAGAALMAFALRIASSAGPFAPVRFARHSARANASNASCRRSTGAVAAAPASNAKLSS
jgi:hypothetical protein